MLKNAIKRKTKFEQQANNKNKTCFPKRGHGGCGHTIRNHSKYLLCHNGVIRICQSNRSDFCINCRVRKSISPLSSLENFYYHTIKYALEHYFGDFYIQMVAIKQKLQREALCVGLQRKGRAANSVLYPQHHRLKGTLDL